MNGLTGLSKLPGVGCSSCLHWREQTGQQALNNLKNRIGVCVEGPPQMILMPSPQGMSLVATNPTTPDTYLCGRYRKNAVTFNPNEEKGNSNDN